MRRLLQVESRSGWVGVGMRSDGRWGGRDTDSLFLWPHAVGMSAGTAVKIAYAKVF